MTSVLPPRVRRRRRSGSDVGFWISSGILALITVAAVFAPLIAPYEADGVDFGAIWEGPSAQHLLGTDQLGRDLFSRLLIGAGETLVGPVVLLALATVIGVAIGVMAAWRGGGSTRSWRV